MTWLCATVVIGPLVAIIALGVWARRGEQRGDRAGERTRVTFRASREKEEQSQTPPGASLARSIAAAIVEGGLETDTPSEGDHGWAFVTRRPRAHIEIVATEDEPDAWHAMVLDSSSGGPGPIAVALALDRALRGLGHVRDVRWHRREGFDPFALDAGAEHPTDA